jgi:hypothetical protein
MTPQISNTSISAEEAENLGVRLFLAGLFAGGGLDSDDCGPISANEFKLLIGIVAFATFAFGCIVHGWLI